MTVLMNKKQLAERLGVSVDMVHKKVSRREWPFTFIGRHVRFSEDDFEQIVTMGKQPVLTTPPALSVVWRGHPPAGPSTPPPPPRPTGPGRVEHGRERAA